MTFDWNDFKLRPDEAAIPITAYKQMQELAGAMGREVRSILDTLEDIERRLADLEEAR